MRSSHVACLTAATLLSTLAVACSSSTTGSGGPADSDGGSKSADGGSKRVPLPGSTKDGAADPQPGEEATCRSAVVCIGDCADGNDACVEACISGLSQAETTKLTELAQCIEDSSCADDACIEEACGAEIQACVGG